VQFCLAVNHPEPGNPGKQPGSRPIRTNHSPDERIVDLALADLIQLDEAGRIAAITAPLSFALY
jgi:hypothetical protein